uniref:Sulfur globule protein CV3 n=1 Tax=Candidatus Kentrum sp. TC TaxID=2126339 RepID=A0A450Z069_9GAMM|nr:MAG: hypothetical protein BECKTC1821E_GA0114239_10785 [Candidatus Kentron sp. TC]VFK47460.1 MAG: hypothetical protein BECKTC1821D_GA0114238_104716 [Candidatus Kentron sp. TC]VFK60488.1 MAG: hypothetical protein BECKTC1821F_GA0114240_104617 [Candidatus Kentron sp. TC]
MKKLTKLAAAVTLVGAMVVVPFQSANAFWGGGYWDDGYGWGPYGGRGWNRWGGGPWGYGYGYGGYGYPGWGGYYGGYPGWGGYYGGWGYGYYPPVGAPLVPAPTAPAKAKSDKDE